MVQKICLSLLLLLLVACNKETETFTYKASNPVYSHTLQLSVEATPEHTYSLYLPSTYSSQKSYPLMVCFSPSADGKTPVDSLRYAAEAFGYIVAGSNMVRNNFDGNVLAVKNLIWDIQKKYSVNEKRIYACGFSGGGRLATMLSENSMVSGVISCSAGPGNARFLSPTPWYGLGGKSDFNYNEMLNYTPRESAKANYAVAFHPKGHEWPDSSYLYDALAFIEIRSMKNTITPNEAILEAYHNYILAQANRLQSDKRYIDAANITEIGIRALKGLYPTDVLEGSLSTIKTASAYKVETIRIKELDDLDKKLTSTYAAAFVKMDRAWWDTEIQKLDKRIEVATGETKFALLRVKGSLGIIGYMYSKRFVENQQKEADQVLGIYELLEPDNPDVYYYKALQAKNKNQTTQEKAFIEKSIALGLSDQEHRLAPFSDVLND